MSQLSPSSRISLRQGVEVTRALLIWKQRRIDAARPALAISRVRWKISTNIILALRQLSRRENSAKPSTWKGGNAFGSIEPQVTTTSETSCWEDQRLNRCSGYVLLQTPKPSHSMQARLPIRPVLLPKSCVGGTNAPSPWRTGATLRYRCQCHSAPSTGCWPSAPLSFLRPQPESEPEPTYGRDAK